MDQYIGRILIITSTETSGELKEKINEELLSECSLDYSQELESNQYLSDEGQCFVTDLAVDWSMRSLFNMQDLLKEIKDLDTSIISVVYIDTYSSYSNINVYSCVDILSENVLAVIEATVKEMSEAMLDDLQGLLTNQRSATGDGS